MKKTTLLLLLLISTVSYSQYSKKELKRIKKLNIRVNNRGLDLSEPFVYISTREGSTKLYESVVKEAFFNNNLNVGEYFYAKETNTNVIDGRYVMKQQGKIFEIKDLESGKLVATITTDKFLYLHDGDKERLYIDAVIKALIKSNK